VAIRCRSAVPRAQDTLPAHLISHPDVVPGMGRTKVRTTAVTARALWRVTLSMSDHGPGAFSASALCQRTPRATSGSTYPVFVIWFVRNSAGLRITDPRPLSSRSPMRYSLRTTRRALLFAVLGSTSLLMLVLHTQPRLALSFSQTATPAAVSLPPAAIFHAAFQYSILNYTQNPNKRNIPSSTSGIFQETSVLKHAPGWTLFDNLYAPYQFICAKRVI